MIEVSDKHSYDNKTGRLIASSSWRRLEGLDCSSIKAVRELGSVRGDTARFFSVAVLWTKYKGFLVRKDL